MKALVTGATGFLGRRLVRDLLDERVDVRCAVRPMSNTAGIRDFLGTSRWSGVDVHRVVLEDLDSCRQVIQDCDVIFHLAASLTGSTATMVLNTVIPTRRLIEAVCEAGTLQRFVHVSSLGVYGTEKLKKGAILDEDCELDPHPDRRDPYSYSKVIQEQVIWQAHREHQLPVVVVRPGVIYGPGRNGISSRVGLRLGQLILRMGGRQKLPYTHVDNCANAILLAGIADGVAGQAINVVDDRLPTGRELLKWYRRAGHKFFTVGIPQWALNPLSRFNKWYHHWSQGQIPAVMTPYKSQALWKPLKYSNERAKTLLKWEPGITFDTGIQSTLADY